MWRFAAFLIYTQHQVSTALFGWPQRTRRSCHSWTMLVLLLLLPGKAINQALRSHYFVVPVLYIVLQQSDFFFVLAVNNVEPKWAEYCVSLLSNLLRQNNTETTSGISFEHLRSLLTSLACGLNPLPYVAEVSSVISCSCFHSDLLTPVKKLSIQTPHLWVTLYLPLKGRQLGDDFNCSKAPETAAQSRTRGTTWDAVYCSKSSLHNKWLLFKRRQSAKCSLCTLSNTRWACESNMLFTVCPMKGSEKTSDSEFGAHSVVVAAADNEVLHVPGRPSCTRSADTG